MPLKWLPRPTARTWLLVLAGLIAGGMIHIVAVLALPRLAAERMMAPILDASRLNELVVLPPATPDDQVVPFMAPDVRYALCRFDLSEGALSLKTAFLDSAWSIAIYDLSGRTVYAVSGADLERREVEMLLTRSEDLEVVGAISLARDRPASSIPVTVPISRGLLVIRAPVPGTAYAGYIDRELAKASCELRASGNRKGGAAAPELAPQP